MIYCLEIRKVFLEGLELVEHYKLLAEEDCPEDAVERRTRSNFI